MNVHTLLNGFRTQIFFAIAILTFLSIHASPTNAQGNGPEGTWLVRVSVEDAPPGFPVPFDALETFGRGGGFVTSNNNPLIPALVSRLNSFFASKGVLNRLIWRDSLS